MYSFPLLPADVSLVRPVVEAVEIGSPAARVPPAAVTRLGASISTVIVIERTELLAEVIDHSIAYEREKGQNVKNRQGRNGQTKLYFVRGVENVH